MFDTQELDDFVWLHPEVFPSEKGYQAGIAMIEPERIPEIADALLDDGWSDTDLRRVLEENNLRVAREVWKDAHLEIDAGQRSTLARKLRASQEDE